MSTSKHTTWHTHLLKLIADAELDSRNRRCKLPRPEGVFHSLHMTITITTTT